MIMIEMIKKKMKKQRALILFTNCSNFIILAGTMNLARITSVTQFPYLEIFIILARITDINRLDIFSSNLYLYCIIVKFSKIELWIKNVTIRTDYLTVISQIT